MNGGVSGAAGGGESRRLLAALSPTTHQIARKTRYSSNALLWNSSAPPAFGCRGNFRVDAETHKLTGKLEDLSVSSSIVPMPYNWPVGRRDGIFLRSTQNRDSTVLEINCKSFTVVFSEKANILLQSISHSPKIKRRVRFVQLALENCPMSPYRYTPCRSPGCTVL